MKISSFLLIISFVSITAKSFSQSKISLDLKNVTVKEVFDDIEKRSEFKFLYRNELVNVNRIVSVSVTNEPVVTVLAKLFDQSDLAYKVFEDNLVVVTSRIIMQQKLAGVVTDLQTGDPLPGVNVVIEGTTIGVITDSEGKYSIDINGDHVVLIFSSIGYLSEKITYGGQNTLDVKLSPDIKKLDEVVVIGYGVTSKKNFTGSVTQLKTDNSPLALVPRTDAMEILRGTIPGMTVSQEQGAGQTPSLLIRGQRSINGGTDPLIVLDGVIYMGSIRDIDPSTIESLNVLKDATSVAAYGSRAANGVIMINTKKGKLGKPVINFQTSMGVSKVINKAKVLSTENWIKKVNLLQGLNEDADPTSWMSDFEDENYVNNKTTDWQDFVERNGSTKNYALSVSGATDRMNYYVSGSLANVGGVLIGDDYSRKSVNLKLTTNITNWLEIGGNSGFSVNDYSGPTNYDIYQSIRMTPYGRPYRDEEKKLLEKYPATEGVYRLNPLWSIKSGTIDDNDLYKTSNLGGHAFIKCPWIEGLSYRLNYSYINQETTRDYFTHEGYYVKEGTEDSRYSTTTTAGFLTSANGYNAHTTEIWWVWDNIINYNKNFGKHSVDLTGVYTRDSYNYYYKKVSGSNFSSLGNTTLGYNGLAYATTILYTLSNVDKKNIGYLARLNYAYNNRYHFTASVRRDGSSVFGADNKWGVFPSFGVAWTATEENFLKNNSILSYLKVKLSWGKNGNQSLSPYATLSPITLGSVGSLSYPFGNTSTVSWGQRPTGIGNTSLGWESTSAINGGFELGLWNNKISLNVDAYKSETTGQIFTRTIPVMANGITSMKETMGQVNNWGIEATLNSENLSIGDFKWTSSLIFYLNRNKLKDLYGDGKDDISNSLFINKSLGAIYGYKPIGIVQEDDTEYMTANSAVAGDVKFYDKDNSGTITSDDKCILGYAKENFRLSFSNTLTYKNFELFAMFTGIFGGKDYYKSVNIYAYRTASDVVYDNNFDHGWWTSENKSNKYPRVGYTDSRFTPVQDRSFLRLQNLSLAYNFNQSWVKKLSIANFKVYAAATNVFTISGWVGGDPETGQSLGSGYSYGYPLSGSYTLGANLTF